MVYYLREMAYMGENANTLWGQSAAEVGYVELAAPYSEHGPSEPQCSERAVRGAEDQPGDVCARQVDLRRGRLVRA